MADKSISLKVVAEGDFSDVEKLETLIDDIKSKSDVTISVNTDELQTAFEQATSEVERLQNELAAIEMGESSADFDQVSQALAEAEAEAERLGEALNTLNGENVTSVSSSFDEVGTSADNATTEIDELQSSMDLFNAQALMGISSELGSLGSQAENMAQEMNTASITVGQLATQTGIAEPKLVSMINNISNATFPNDEAMMYVKSLDQIGVSSDNLGKSATDLDKINDAFGLGASTVNSLGQELSVLGVDMNNVSSSFNALAYANANTVGGMENYYTFLRKYDSQFKELGYNVDQASIIIAAATQKYGGGRAALSGLSTALKEANGDSRKLEEALGLQAGALDNASEITGQYEGQLQQLANEEAEHKTWLDQVGAAWEDLSLSMSPVLSPLASFMGMIGQVGSWAVGVNGIIQLANHFRSLDSVQGLIGKFNSLKTTLMGVASTIKGSVVTAFNGMKMTLSTVASTIKGGVVGAFNTLKNTMTGTIIPALKNVATSFLEAGKSALTAGLNALRSAGMWLAQKAQLIASTVATWAQTVAQWALNSALLANPLTWVVVALVALVVALVWAYQNVDWFRQMVDGAWQSLTMLAGQIWGAVTGALQWIGNLFQQFTSQLGLNSQNWIQAILGFILFMPMLPLRLGIALADAIAKALGFGNNFVSNMISTGQKSVTNFISYISQIPQKLGAELSSALDKVNEWASTLPQKFWDAGVNAVKNFLDALGIHSPGTMQRMLVWEVSEMGRRVPIEAQDLLTNIGKVGAGVVDEFGNPELDVGFRNSNIRMQTGNEGLIETVQGTLQNNDGGDTIINVYGDVDNDRRVNQIVEAVRRELNWDNKTAGRTI